MKRRRTKRKRRSRTFLDSNLWFSWSKRVQYGSTADIQILWLFFAIVRWFDEFILHAVFDSVSFWKIYANIRSFLGQINIHTYISIPNAINKWVHTEKEPCESLTNSQQTHAKQ